MTRSRAIWMRYLAVACVVLLAGAAVVGADVPLSEREALIALYESTSGDSWLVADGWRGAASGQYGEPGTECSWYGVECDPDGSHVVGLDLHENALNGPLPAEIGQLSELRYLWLFWNHVSGSLPPEVGQLVHLESVRMERNALSGPIPPEVGSCTALTELGLGDTGVQGPIPPELGQLDKVWVLSLIDNRLTGSIPPELGEMSSMKWLWLTGNELEGPIPPELGNLTALEILLLSENRLTGPIPPELGQCTRLKNLNLFRNQLEGPIPAVLGALGDLRFLSLSENRLTGPIPPELGELTGLEGLYLDDNRLTGSIPASFGRLQGLRDLVLSRNRLTGSIPEELGKLDHLERLRAFANDLEGHIPALVGGMRSLRSLILSANRLTGPIPPEMTQLTQLEFLELVVNGLWSEDPAVQSFLDQAHHGPWEEPQTVAPADVQVTVTGERSAEVQWSAVDLSLLEGYEGYSTVLVARSPDGPYIPYGDTSSLDATTLAIDGLIPGSELAVAVQTTSLPFQYNSSLVRSEIRSPVSIVTPGQPPAVESLGSYLLSVPAVAHLPGAEGTLWRTDLAVHNPGDAAADVRIAFVPRNQDGGGAGSTSWQVAAGGSLLLADVVGQMAPQNAAGALLIGSDRDVRVTTRTFNETLDGTFGQFIPAEGVEAAMTTRDSSVLLLLTGGADFRTNLGAASFSPHTVTVDVELLDGSGASISSGRYELPPYGAIQLNDVLGDSGPSLARAEVTAVTPGAAVVAWGSVVDNRSGDPIYVRPVAATWDRCWVPGVAHIPGANGTLWRTDLELYNPDDEAAVCRIELVARDGDGSVASSARVTVPPRTAVRSSDVVGSLLASSGAGAIRIAMESGRVMATSRTFNDSVLGTFGQLIPAVPEERAVRGTATAWISHLAHSVDPNAGRRTNIGLVNLSDTVTSLTVTLYDGDGEVLGDHVVELPGFGNTQLNNVLGQLDAGAVDNAVAAVRADHALARFAAYASVVDNRSGDPVYVPAAAVQPPAKETR